MSRLRVWARAVQHPVVTVALALVLALDIWAWAGPESGVLGEPRSRTATVDLHVVREPGAESLRVIDPESESWGEIATTMHANAERLMLVEYFYLEERSGSWAPTRRRRATWLALTPFSADAFSGEEMAEARRLVVDYLRESSDAPEWSLRTAAQEQSGEQQVLVSGMLHNAASAAAALGFLWSLGWVPRVPRNFRAARGRRRLSRGLCPRCRYDLVGSPAPPCPECGAAW